MSSVDYETEYNNRARVLEHPAIIQGWTRDAAAYREQAAPIVLKYGEGERQTIDVFGSGDGPLVLFIHGGYWQSLDKSFFSHMARGLVHHGVRAGVMNYDLCPNVRLGEIVEQGRAAAALLARAHNRPVVVSGHSAGGHLAACLLATEAHVPAAYAISGLFDLVPLIPTSLNVALTLDKSEAEALSPIMWPAPAGKTLDAVVGAAESGEFLRQSQAIVDLWSAEGVAARYEAIDAANHFTVIAPLADPSSAMTCRLAALAGASA
ncbi:MAG: alpha/beta hydrolase [Hyphomonadaceae bacterium]